MRNEGTCSGSIAGVLAALLLAGCAGDPTTPTGGERLRLQCSGKCDGASDVVSLLKDWRDVDLGDLVARGAAFGTDALSDALSVGEGGGRAGVSIEGVELYGGPADADGDLTVHDLEDLAFGIARRFGERELVSRVLSLRAAQVASGRARYFAETAFRADASLASSLTIEAEGLGDVPVTLLGMGRGGVEGRIVTAHASGEAATVLRAPLAAAARARGFVLPRRLEELRAMAPGESLALRGEGVVGINVGAGVPLLVAEPVSAVAYRLVFSAALRATLEGTVDAQLVRLDGDRVVLEVGVERARVLGATLAVRDGWGVDGLVEADVEIAGREVDLGRLADRALSKALDRKLQLLEARASRGSTTARMALARFQVDLSAAGPEVGAAIGQALRGDVRLLQALGQLPGTGVVQEFDVLRSGFSRTGYAGLDLFGMSFFRRELQREGTIVIEEPGGAEAWMYDTLRRESGWFFSSHGFVRAMLAGLRFDETGRPTQGIVSLALQAMEGADWMERDELLDHLDALLLALGGPRALAAVEEPGNALQAYVEARCAPGEAFDPCYTEVLGEPRVAELREQALAGLEAATAALPTSARELLRRVAELRLAEQATFEPHASLVGPPASVVAEIRLGDRALDALAEVDPEALHAALLAVGEASGADRMETGAGLQASRRAGAEAVRRQAAAVAERFAAFVDAYRAHRSAELAELERVGQVGREAMVVRLALDGAGRIDYAALLARSPTAERGLAVRDAIDDFIEAAEGFEGLHAEAAVLYALLSVLPTDLAEVSLRVDMDLSDRFSQSYGHYREAGVAPAKGAHRGSGVEPRDNAVFDVEALSSVERL